MAATLEAVKEVEAEVIPLLVEMLEPEPPGMRQTAAVAGFQQLGPRAVR